MDLSLIVTLHNQIRTIELLYEKISLELKKLSLTYEIIFIDNSSKDGTEEKIKMLKSSNPNIKLVVLSKNVSNIEAAIHGLNLASGEYIVTMDGNMDYDPADIIRFIIMIQSGFDVVCGWRKAKKTGLFLSSLFSKIANAIISSMTHIKFHDIDCPFKGFRNSLLYVIRAYSDIYRFLPLIAASKGANVGEVEVAYKKKVGNHKGFNILQGFKLLSDIILVKILVDFSSRPFWFFGLLSIPFWIIGSYLFGIYLYDIFSSQHQNSIVIPGICILYIFLSMSINMFGFLSELIVKTGDLNKEVMHDK